MVNNLGEKTSKIFKKGMNRGGEMVDNVFGEKTSSMIKEWGDKGGACFKKYVRDYLFI